MRTLTAAQLRVQSRICALSGPALHPAVVSAGLKYPADMAQGVFIALQAVAEAQERAVALGRDCVQGFDEEAAAVASALDASQWCLHPDHGCVLAVHLALLDQVVQA